MISEGDAFMAKRAQFSFDLLVIVAIMLVLFLSLFQYYSSKSEAALLTRHKASAKGISEGLASRANAVLQAGNGSQANFSLPEALADGVDYSVSAANRRVEVSFPNSAVSSLLLTSDVSSIDLNTRKGSEVLIRNIGGGLSIE